MSYCSPQKYVSMGIDIKRDAIEDPAPYFTICIKFEDPIFPLSKSKVNIYTISMLCLTAIAKMKTSYLKTMVENAKYAMAGPH